MTPPDPRVGARYGRVMVLAACAVVLALQYVLWSHVTDDAYISFRYIRRLLDGQGLTFNDGERVEGFSHPLWILLVAGCTRLTGLAVPEVAKALGLACSISTIACLFASRRAFALGNEIASVAIALLLVFPGFHVYATAGLETPLLMFLLTMGTVASLGRREPTTLSSVSFGFAAIARPEGLLYGLFWLGRRFRSFRQLAIVIAPFVTYQLFRLTYFETWLPNTFRAKLPGTWGTFFGLEYLWPAVTAVGWPLLLGVLLVRRRADLEDFRIVLRAAIGPITAGILFILYAWGDWMPFSRFLVPVWPSVALLLASSLVALGHSMGRNPKPIVALLTILVGASTLGTYAPQIQRYSRNQGLDSMLMRGEDTLRLGVWLSKAVRPGSTVQTARLGGMSYAAPELTFWDENGLTDRAQAVWISEGRPGGPPASPVRVRDPDVVAALLVPAKWSYTEDEALLEWLRSSYFLVSRFPQGDFGEVHVWISKSRERRIFRSPSGSAPPGKNHSPGPR